MKTIPGPAKSTKQTKASSRHQRDRPAPRTPYRKPNTRPHTAVEPRMKPVPVQLNTGSVEISRIHTRAATPHARPSAKPAAAA